MGIKPANYSRHEPLFIIQRWEKQQEWNGIEEKTWNQGYVKQKK